MKEKPIWGLKISEYSLYRAGYFPVVGADVSGRLGGRLPQSFRFLNCS